MEQLVLEGLADAMYARAKLDPERPHVTRLARTLLGAESIERGPRPIPGPAALVRSRNGWRIIIAHELAPLDALFAIGHELAHWVFQRERIRTQDEERDADALGAALITPRAAFRAAYRAHGEDLSKLADVLHTTETGAALRLGEVTGRPLAVVAPARVRVRGLGEWEWPDELTLRRWARRPAPGLRKTKLRDDPRRVVLDASHGVEAAVSMSA